MNICKEEFQQNQKFICGNLYIFKNKPEWYDICISINKTNLMILKTGEIFSVPDGSIPDYINVTTLYCLQKVK